MQSQNDNRKLTKAQKKAKTRENQMKEKNVNQNGPGVLASMSPEERRAAENR